MGSASGGRKKYSWNSRNKQRANLSFFLVLAFFMVFGVIIFTEIFFMDDRQNGMLIRHNSLSYRGDKEEYDDALQNDDYISIRDGGVPSLDETVGALLLGERNSVPLPLLVEEKIDPPKPQIVTENQLPQYPANKTPTDGNWQTVNGTKFKFFVFSAFFDRRKSQRSVRIIAATKTRVPERVWCRLWYKPAESNSTIHTSRTVAAKIKVIRENWNLKYSACFVLCHLQLNQTAPVAVSVVAKVLLPPANLLMVNDFYNKSKSVEQFGVCIKPLHYEYNRALQILEFIELNRLLGVTHFTFYNHTIGSQVNCILKDYIARGVVTLLPWHLNIPSQKEIRTEGLFAALNDCLYRSMYKFSHILLIDLDEYIIPHHNDTLSQLINYLGTRMMTRTTGSYSFQNAFFYLQWGDADWVHNNNNHNIDNDPVAANLITLKKTRRKSKLHPHKQRSKYICKPELVVEAGNHFVWEFIPGHGTYNVPADAAILHHYRICEFGGDDCIKAASTVDTTMFKYREQLVDIVKSKYKQYKNKCNLKELSPSSSSSTSNKHQYMKIFKSSLANVKYKTAR